MPSREEIERAIDRCKIEAQRCRDNMQAADTFPSILGAALGEADWWSEQTYYEGLLKEMNESR